MAVSYTHLGQHPNYPDKRMCLVFTNCEFMGLPLLDAMYGSYGIFLGSSFIVVNNLLLWRYGVSQLSHDVPRMQRIRNVLINPGTVSLVIGLLFFLTPLEMPAIPATVFSYLASLKMCIRDSLGTAHLGRGHQLHCLGALHGGLHRLDAALNVLHVSGSHSSVPLPLNARKGTCP